MSVSQWHAAMALFFIMQNSFASESDDFHVLLEESWQWTLDENPVFASMLGDRRANDKWEDLSLAAIERRYKDQREILARLGAIDSSKLSDADRLNYELFQRGLQDELDANKYRNFLMPVNQRGGVQSLESTAEGLALNTVQDYEDWIARMSSVDTVIDQTIALQEAGRKEGYMPPRILMERIPDQLSAQLVEDAGDSPFFIAFKSIPDNIPDDEKERLRQSARTVIDEELVPAYRDYKNYFEKTYLPASRESIAASELPNGEAFYEFRVRKFTTTSMTPDEIHRIGLNEVKRIRDEMQLIIDELEFAGDFSDFLNFLRTDPRFYYDNPEDLFNGYLAICKRIDPQLVKLFGKLPRMPYGLRAIPDNIAPDTTTAYYSRPSGDGTRAGYYYVNLYKPEVRPKYEMEVLSVHEAVPGHHLQIALQMEMPDMPNFRRYSGFTAFTEGWGLYRDRKSVV